ncbi:hypothetical protein CK203_109821 [Vitis vinifera]|uniref:Uncharacterized protein n=2 Tax=Vitis vinifera TaxID=29760 RepID=A0A438CFL7_VITVI|nr:hypothetical protein CK203_109821 [Vitis vinifera]
MPTEKGGKNVILFTKEQFNAGLRFPLPSLFKEFLHFSQIPPIFIHPNLVRCVRSLPSLQMVTELPDSTKGGAKGLVAVWGGWAGLSQHPSRPFSPNYTLKIPGLELRGHLVDWVEKASFACVCKLFEIDPKERAYKTLLCARNLTKVVREPQEYEAKEADAERRRKLLEDRDQKKTEGTIRKAPGQKRGPDSPPKKTSGKRGKLVKKHGKDMKEPTPPKEFPPPQTAYEGEVMIEEPVNAAPHSISSGPDACRGSGSRNPKSAFRRPGSPGHSPGERASPQEAAFDAHLQSGLFERLQERQQEIEISCASAHDAHPDGGEVEMATETSAAPAIIPAEDASGPMCPNEDMGVPIPGQELPSASSPEEESADDAAPASLSATRSWKLTGRGLRSMSQQHDLFTQLLQTADYMRTFSSRHQEIENQLRLRMEEAEASLSTMREENEALRVELAEAKGREESTAGRLHEAEGEAARLRDELSRLRTEVLNEKKQKEDLQLRLDVQKEELEREFAVEREELAADYQKQVDDTFIFGYRCCMKKNGIKRDTLQFLQVKKRSSMRNLLPDSLSLFAIFLL